MRPPGEPTDRLVAVYALLSGAALAFPNRPDGWLLLALVHAAALVAGLGPEPVRRAGRAASRAWPATASFLHDWYPLFLIPLLYSELPLLNRAVHEGIYFDGVVQGWEQAIFGGQPSRTLAAAMPWKPLSELLHLSYLSYYLLIFGPALMIRAAGRRADFRRAVFALMLTFVAHYLFFVWFPVQGPRYLFPAPGGSLADGPFYRLAHAVLEAGSSQGAAFPSSHVGVAVAQTLVTRRYLGKWWLVAATLTAGLAAGAVYGGFHYATDVLAGAALGALCCGVAFRNRAAPGRPSGPDEDPPAEPAG